MCFNEVIIQYCTHIIQYTTHIPFVKLNLYLAILFENDRFYPHAMSDRIYANGYCAQK
jgi:hypothetical protein